MTAESQQQAHDEQTRATTRVLIASDGSGAALAAARNAARLLRHPLAITLLHVLTDTPGDDAGGIEGPVATPEEEAREWERDQHEAREVLRVTARAFDNDPSSATETTVETRVAVGDAGPTICVAAEESGADVIVIGMGGKGRISALLFGSTTEHVIRHARCPVLLGRDPDD